MVSVAEHEGEHPWRKRVGWLLLLWLLGVTALGLVALLLKFVMRLAGLTT